MTPAKLTALALVALAAVLALVFALQPGSRASAAVTNLALDTYRANNTHATVTGPVLDSGQHYTITITGTYSYWFASDWQAQGVCAGEHPENMPMFSSPGVTNSKVGDDAAWHFAGPNTFSDCDAVSSHGGFTMSVDGGNTTFDADPVDAGTGPNAGHVYHFDVVGAGDTIVFSVPDNKTVDNYGILKISIEAAASPTPTPVRQTEKWGDNNCDGKIDIDDFSRAMIALAIPAKAAHIDGCPDMGQVVELITFTPSAMPKGSGALTWGSVYCAATLLPVHALDVLKYVAGVTLPHVEFCPYMGDEVTFQ